jgi:hypothetical protein
VRLGSPAMRARIAASMIGIKKHSDLPGAHQLIDRSASFEPWIDAHKRLGPEPVAFVN